MTSPASATKPPRLAAEHVPGHPDFRPLASLAGVAHDLRYAGPDNFTGAPLYTGHDTAFLRREAAEGVERAAAWLATHRPGHRLLILDALRPQRIQQAIWERVRDTPMQPYFADPVRGSIHSFGMAIDVTVLGPDGRERDMGAGFDEMSPRSHPALEAEHLARGELQAAHLVERGWLYGAMRAGGFQGIPTEWWHFDFGDREATRRHLPRVW